MAYQLKQHTMQWERKYFPSCSGRVAFLHRGSGSSVELIIACSLHFWCRSLTMTPEGEKKKREKKRKNPTPLSFFSIFTYSESTSIKISSGGKTHRTVQNNPQDKLICEVTNHRALQTPTHWLLPSAALLHTVLLSQKVILILLPCTGDRLTLCTGQPS